MQPNFTNKLNFLNLILLSLLLTACDDNSKNSHFTITPDTKIEPNSEISKYVTQEEVDSFAFRYWDIDNNYTKYLKPIVIPLRDYLKQKDTNKVLSYLKDNNLSVDILIEDGTTPIMYSAFYNDENTTKELIKLGADIHKKDKYGLNALAYAISMNSLEVVKLLYNNGVKFEEAPITQGYILAPSYSNIEKLIIDGDNIEIIYKYNYIQKDYDTPKGGGYMFEDVVYKNWLELGKFMLDSGYKPYPYFFTGGDSMVYGNSINDFISQETIDKEIKYTKNNNPDDFNLKLFMDEFSYDYTLYKRIENTPNHEPMLNLLLDYNVSGQPSKELLKKEYDRCYKVYKSELNWIENEIRSIEKGEAEYDIELELKKRNNLNIFDSEIYKNNYLNLYPRKADTKTIRFKKKDLHVYKSFCSDINSTFRSTKEYIHYKNWRNKTIELNRFINGYPGKVYLKNENMTLRQYTDKIYENYLNENRGKNGKKLK